MQLLAYYNVGIVIGRRILKWNSVCRPIRCVVLCPKSAKSETIYLFPMQFNTL